jgi:hypothetical protein
MPGKNFCAACRDLRSSWLRAVFAMLTALCVCAGCQRNVPQPAAQSADNHSTVNVPHDEASTRLPPDFYKDMPIFPGSTVTHVLKPHGVMREIIFQSRSELQEMVAYYKEQLKKNGYSMMSSLIMPARRTWSSELVKDGHPVRLLLFPSDEDKTVMTIELNYEIPSTVDQALLEPREGFDVVGPGEIARKSVSPARSTPGAGAK